MSETDSSRFCHFVSDLHLQSRRSYGNELTDSIRQAASDSHTFVLGGDLFDFKWSTRRSLEAAVREAESWLEELIVSYPQCEFQYVVGNHDHNRRFLERLELLESRHSNFDWHPFVIRAGENVFLHGDVANGYPDQEALAESREKWFDEESKAEIWHRLYSMVVAMRLHVTVSAIAHRKLLIARRIMQWLEATGHGPASGIRRVYFGHTHSPVDGYEYQGLRFFNPGGAIHGLRCQILQVEGSERTVDFHD